MAKKKQSPTDEPPECYFFKLPAEIRNEIYILVLRPKNKDKPIVISSPWKKPALVQVNKQIRAETKGLWYDLNTFGVYVHNNDFEVLAADIIYFHLDPYFNPAHGFCLWIKQTQTQVRGNLITLVSLIQDLGVVFKPFPEAEGVFSPGAPHAPFPELMDIGEQSFVEGWSWPKTYARFGMWLDQQKTQKPLWRRKFLCNE